MSPQQTQDNTQGNQAAASLAFATQLQQQMMPKAQPEMTENAEQPMPQPSQPQEDMKGEIEKLGEIFMKELESLRKEIKKPDDTQKEIDSIREELNKLENGEDK